MRCPSCHEENGYEDDEMCDKCYAEIQRQHDEYLANLPLSQKIARGTAKAVTNVKFAVHQWNTRRKQ